MKRGKTLKRTKGARPEQRRFLIYCEGERTEDQYFKGLRADLRSLPVTICLGGEHGEPQSLVRAAIEHQRRAPTSPQDRRTAYDEVWCVIDVEAPTPHKRLNEALGLARKNGVSVALTNPCFELWLMLHFVDVKRYSTSVSTQKDLEKLGGCGYTAARKHVEYDALRGGYDQARKRAQALRQSAVEGHRQNPWTDVDVLIESLREARQV